MKQFQFNSGKLYQDIDANLKEKYFKFFSVRVFSLVIF